MKEGGKKERFNNGIKDGQREQGVDGETRTGTKYQKF